MSIRCHKALASEAAPMHSAEPADGDVTTRPGFPCACPAEVIPHDAPKTGANGGPFLLPL